MRMNMFSAYAIILLLVYFGLFLTQCRGQSFLDDVFGTPANYSECGKTINIDKKSTDFLFTNTESRNSPGSWPWLISMGTITAGGGWIHNCGGTLVDAQYVVTAAHCPLGRHKHIKLGEIYIRAGDSHLKNNTDDAGVQIVKVASYTVHPGYKRPNRYSDIGVLRLEHPVNFTEVCRTICLPDSPIDKSSETTISYTVTGWGEDDKSQVGEDLHDASVQVYPEEYCNRTHRNDNQDAVPRGFTSDLFCGADPAGHSEGTCHGDSGSPAVLFEPLKNRFVLRGVVSGGLTCGTGRHPNIYVRVTDQEILQWTTKQLLRKIVPPLTHGTDLRKRPLGCVKDIKLEEECICSGEICKSNHICVEGNKCIPDPEYPDCGTRFQGEDSSELFRNKRAFQTVSDNPPGSWPWTLSIGQPSGLLDGLWNHNCGAALVTVNSVITAAHCTTFMEKEIELGEVYIRVGDGNLQDEEDDAGVQVIQVASFIVHPDYSRVHRYADIAVLKLATPVRLSTVVRTICLPPAPTLRDQDNNLLLEVTGWGANSFDSAGENLVNIGAQVFAEEYCNSTHFGERRAELAVPHGFTSDLLCAGDRANGDGLCHGDSGNPAAFFQSQRDKYILKGIGAGGLSCGSAIHPNIYVRIADKKILNWIRLQIWKTSGPICRTTSVNEKGGRTNASCIFPFIHKGETYNSCAYHDKLEDYWCSTKVDTEGTHISGQKEWGICGPECPVN